MGSTDARMRVEVATGDPLDVRHVSVREQMSSLFHITLVAVSELADIDFEPIVGAPARFEFVFGTGRTRAWAGVCSQVQQIRSDAHGVSTYELVIVPTFWMATQRRNHRVFQRMTEPEIALEVLREWGIQPDVRLGGVYKTRKYRVQYGESDYAFVCRMLEDAGVSFYFDADGGESKLVLADAPHGNATRSPALQFRDNPITSALEHVTALRVGRRARPGKYTVRDHDYRRAPTYPLMTTAAGGSAAEAPLESFHYVPGGFLYESAQGGSTPFADDRGKFRADEGEGALLGQRRLEAKRATARTTTFDTTALDLAPGAVISITDHPRGEVDSEKLLVLGVTISALVDGEWVSHCEACSAEVPYRPPLATPKPKVSGVECATVVGPAGTEIHTDEFGRVRVQFHWDRLGTMDERSSCWIHVSQPWGGAGYGGVNLPRIGQEVIVDFLGGDPDRPIVVGRVYTNLEKVPYKLPDHKTQSGWKSHSSPTTGGYNEIMFEDAAGEELVRIQAEKDLHRLVKHDEQDTVGHDRTRLVGNDEALTVVNNRTRQVGGNEDIAIALNESETIGLNRAVQVGVNHVESIGAAMALTVGLASAETVGTVKTVTVGDEYSVTCGASKITMDKSGNVVVEATDITLRSSGPVLVQADGTVKVQAGGVVKIVGSTINAN